MTDFQALLERMGAAEGADRELDCRIWAEFDGRDVREQGMMILAKSREPPHDECVIGYIDPGKRSRNFSAAHAQPEYPPVTSSIDAALVLVEKVLPGWRGDIDTAPFETGDKCGARLFPPGKFVNILGEGATPALAILSALLRAMTTKESTGA